VTHSIGIPYDSEVLKINEVMRRVDQMRNQRMNPQDFIDKVIDMFAKIGLEVRVNAYTTGGIEQKGNIEKVEEIPDLYTFDIEMIGRLDSHEFDHDQMAHEVQNNVLGIKGAGGTIKAEKNLDEIVAQYTKGHRH
jgi:hypothetical protein